MIGQLTGLLEYYNTEEREKQEEDIDRFVKKNHLALISTPFLLSLKTISVSAILFIFIGIPIAYLLAKKNLKFK